MPPIETCPIRARKFQSRTVFSGFSSPLGWSWYSGPRLCAEKHRNSPGRAGRIATYSSQKCTRRNGWGGPPAPRGTLRPAARTKRDQPVVVRAGRPGGRDAPWARDQGSAPPIVQTLAGLENTWHWAAQPAPPVRNRRARTSRYVEECNSSAVPGHAELNRMWADSARSIPIL